MIVGEESDQCAASTEAALTVLEPMVASRAPSRSPRFTRLRAAAHPGFLREIDIYANEEFKTEPFYREHIYPYGLGWAAATTFVLPTKELLLVSMERLYDRGPVEPAIVRQLDALRPHLARSSLIAARLQLQQARAVAEALALIGLPALVFDKSGKVLAANSLIEPLTDAIRWRAQDHFSLKDANADALFRQAIATINAEGSPVTRSFAVRGAEASAAKVAHVIPIRGTARDIFVRCAGVLVLTPVALPNAPPVELVQSLFDLTPTEARVARGLTAGQTVEEIASTGNISVTTVRSHVRALLEKTGCRRQVEAVALFGGISVMKA